MTAPLRFTEADAHRAYDEWGANCGPGAVAAITGLTLDELRPHVGSFIDKRYTNPTLMWEILDRIGARWKPTRKPRTWPDYGLARIQWEGPWTAPGVPPRVAYRHTHWVAAWRRGDSVGIFDINAMSSGGWISATDWAETLVPWLLSEAVPKADGRWHITHAAEISREACEP